MNENLKKLETWCELNRLSINTKKTKSVLFCNPKSSNLKVKLSLKFNNDLIEGVEKYVYLGVVLYKTLFQGSCRQTVD